MDTSDADQVYKIYRLLEALYPMTAALAVLLGAVLPGLVIIQTAREASVLRALGTTKKRTRSILTLEQVLLCFVGLLIAGILIAAIHRTELAAMIRPFGLYLCSHLIACVIGSLVFAVSVTKKNVLNLLQEKE